MTWAKSIDRTKFDRRGMAAVSFHKESRKWFCAYWHIADIEDPPDATGAGADPLEAMLAMCIDLGAMAETGEWIEPPCP